MKRKIDVDTLLAGSLADLTERIRVEAHNIHADVNQHYGDRLPYGFHLDAVTRNAMHFLPEVVTDEREVAAVYFGAMNHDSIEDARQTYNDVLDRAMRHFGDKDLAVMATEIAYALTNEKGRTRSERADDRYYAMIRRTPYAPLVKAADRLANATFSLSQTDSDSSKHNMIDVYRGEMPHFLECVADHSATDIRLTVPPALIEALRTI